MICRAARILFGEAIMKCEICQGAGELIEVVQTTSGDESTDELVIRRCDHCCGTGEYIDDLAGRAPRIRPPQLPPLRVIKFDHLSRMQDAAKKDD